MIYVVKIETDQVMGWFFTMPSAEAWVGYDVDDYKITQTLPPNQTVPERPLAKPQPPQ